MAISSCPMCQTSIPSGEIVNTCSGCGSDLSRWTQKNGAPLLVQARSVGANPQTPPPQEVADPNIAMGVAGAALGACIGSGLMYAFYAMSGFRFPLLGVGIGFVTGLIAKKLNNGPDDRLGLASGALAMGAVVGTLYLMYGTFPPFSIISVILSASVAYRLASN